MLIQEGKKALNREIVVMSDAKEDEIDDGSGAWEEVQVPSNTAAAATTTLSSSISRSSSAKRTRRPILSPTSNTFESAPSSLPPFPSSAPNSYSYSSTYTTTPSIPITPRRPHSRARGLSAASPSTSAFEQGNGTSTSISFREDERAWGSPELRESMERARARARMNANMNLGPYREGP